MPAFVPLCAFPNRRPPPPQTNDLIYKLQSCDYRVLHQVFESNGFKHSETLPEWNVLWTTKQTKHIQFEGLHENQRVNIFPKMAEITRKDRLSKNINRMKKKHGVEHFDFVPTTFILPEEFPEF